VGAGTLAIGANATATLDQVPAGDLEVRLTGVRGNCSVQAPHPRLLRVTAGETIRTRFDVACAQTPLLDRIVFSSLLDGTYQLYSMNVDGTDVLQLTHTPEEEREVLPAVSPDGSRIAYVNRIGPEDDFYTEYLYVMNADGTDPVRLSPPSGGAVGAPVWSPDGSQIAFGGWFGEPEDDIWVIDADGTGLRNLTDSPGVGEYSPSWSPDGGRILFATSGRLETMNADGTERAELTEVDVLWAVWSPDGARIAYVTTVDEHNRLYVMNADGSDRTPVTPADDGHDHASSWSPTGDRLAYVHSLNGDIEIWVINADGSGAGNISENEAFDDLGMQAWGP
jgi:Tol biopolymer transport system component